MNDTLLARLSVITDEEKRLRENPDNLDYAAYGSAKQLLEVDAHYKDGTLAELAALLNMHFSAVSKRITL